ncbi:nSTAND1 domain-containing NTPase [Streptomyces asiaticus]|uniref:nSTAND1 domain-containing NTPase n=1 Tax=Streptomyces asiaticus TaxID=114695 RepID=UPI003F6796CE
MGNEGHREPLPRRVFADRLAELLELTADLPLKSAVAEANRRRPFGRGRPISGRRVSDWKRGRHLPDSEMAFLVLVRVLIEHCRGRRMPADEVSAGLLDEEQWRHWLRAARASPPDPDVEPRAGQSAEQDEWAEQAGRGVTDGRWASQCPYRGLAPFGQEQAEVFYGREKLTAQLVHTLADRLDRPGVMLVSGASGAGKSSLVRAGLLPALANGALSAESARWPVAVMHPTSQPRDELARVLAKVGRRDPGAIRAALESAPERAYTLVRDVVDAYAAKGQQAVGSTGNRLVLVVDPFEQLFTLPDTPHPNPGSGFGVAGSVERERADVIAALHAAATVPCGPDGEPAALVIAVIRSDFLPACAAYPQLAQAATDGLFLVGPMTAAQLRATITGPAERAGLKVPPSLVDAILADLPASSSGGGYEVGALPLLSEAMRVTWRHREGDWLTSRGYELSGGVAHAIQTSAEAVYTELTEAQQAAARKVFHRLTKVTPDGQAVRRPMPYRHDDPASEDHAVRDVVEAFAAQRLIVIGENTAQLPLQRRLTGHKGDVGAVAFSPDGHTLATGSDDGTVRLWDPATGRTRRALTSHNGAVRAVAFNPDGHTLATSSADRTVRLWDPATGRTRRILTGHNGAVRAVAFNPDGRTLATADENGTVRLWDSATGRTQRTLTSHNGAVTSVAFNPDGRTLATAGTDDIVRLWDSATGRIRRILTGHKGDVEAVAFSPDGRTLATGGDDRTVRLWDTTGRTRRILTGHKGIVYSVAFSPDGRTLATGGIDGTVRLWDPATGRTRRILTDQKDDVGAVAFSPDGRTLATAADGDTVRLWDPATGRTRSILTGHKGDVVAVAFSPDGRTLATGDDDGTVRLWDPATGRAQRILTGHKGDVYSVAFSPDGKTLATAGGDDTVRLWDPATGRTRRILTSHKDSAWSVAFSPDGRTLATSSADHTVRLWDLAAGRTRETLTVNESVTSMEFSPTKRALATGDEGGTVRLWDPATGRTRTTLTGHKLYVAAVAFSPDGKTLATASEDGTVRLWDAKSPGREDAIKKICQAVGRDLSAKERSQYLADRSRRACPS